MIETQVDMKDLICEFLTDNNVPFVNYQLKYFGQKIRVFPELDKEIWIYVWSNKFNEFNIVLHIESKEFVEINLKNPGSLDKLLQLLNTEGKSGND